MILKRGSTGRDVVAIQVALREHGYYGGDHDGMFGPETERAVRNFQIASSLVPDGVAGPVTRAAMKLDTPPKRRRINQAGLDIIKHFEGLRTEAYLCPGKVWTIGYGHTGNVRKGDTVTEEEAETLLEFDTQKAAHTVSLAVTVPLTDNQFSALVSLVYNIGPGRKDHPEIGGFYSSTLLRKLNEGDYDAVPAQFLRWRKDAGRDLEGLKRRRAAEAELWRKP